MSAMEVAQNRRLDDTDFRDRGLSGLVALRGDGVWSNNEIVPYKEIVIVQKLTHKLEKA